MAFVSIKKKRKKARLEQSEQKFPPVDLSTIAVTKEALAQIRVLAEKEGKDEWYFRVGVQGGGCSGFSYHLDFEKEAKEGDHLLNVDGVRLIVDSKSLQVIGGSILDWYDELMHRGFRLINPHEKKTCSCGSSFSV